MGNRYTYSVNIEINDETSIRKLYSGNAQYAGGGSRLDKILIQSHSISLECERATLIDLNGVFANYHSGLYGQISKTIFFYICVTQKIPDIESLTITAKRGGTIVREKKISAQDFQNHASFSTLKSKISPTSIALIFDESDKGATLLKSISHLVRSKTKEDKFDRFDSLWKSYNSLYRVITKKTKDHDCHVELRQFILMHPTASQAARKFIGGITAAALRDKFRWRALILNDFESQKKTKAFHDFILRYTDSRLIEIFKKILPYREAFLVAQGLLQPVNDHIVKHAKNNITNDQEIVAFLCIKYMYFVRNKSAHGERMDRIIGLTNKEVEEIEWLSDLLEALIIDLINVSNLY